MNELQQKLLARLAGEQDGTNESVVDLIEQSLGDDPAAAPLLAALRKREAAAEEPAVVADPVTEPHDDAGPVAAEVLEQLWAEVEDLRLRNRTVAAALGACARCWGEDTGCRVCGGRGRPGGRTPDAVLYSELVEPAVRRRLRQERDLAAAAKTAPGDPG